MSPEIAKSLQHLLDVTRGKDPVVYNHMLQYIESHAEALLDAVCTLLAINEGLNTAAEFIRENTVPYQKNDFKVGSYYYLKEAKSIPLLCLYTVGPQGVFYSQTEDLYSLIHQSHLKTGQLCAFPEY